MNKELERLSIPSPRTRERGILIFECTLIIVICWLHSLSAGHYTDFYPINGTFQNFNPVRRLLAGQIPYRDFRDYLGLGHLYMGTLLTIIFGGNFQSSLIAFSFLSFGCLAALSVMIGKSVFKDWQITLGLTSIFLIITLNQQWPSANIVTTTVLYRVYDALNTGISARFLRGMILPLTVGLFGIGSHLYTRKRAAVESHKFGKYFPAIGVGCLAGFSFAWSSDYGISCFVCIIIMTFIVSFARERRPFSAFISMAAALVSACISLFLVVELFTLGHWGEWFQATLGTGGYQGWYFGVDVNLKSYYLYDIDVSYIMMIQAVITMTYIIFLFIKRGSEAAVFRYGIPAFANMTGFCAVNEYKLVSGGYSGEIALSVLYLTIICETLCFITNICRNTKWKKCILFASIAISFAWMVSAAKDEIVFQFSNIKEGEYVACLGGNMTSFSEDMEMAHEFLNGEKFFSTYASAQEVMEGIFQPSGTDYIIHALGDNLREKYLADFMAGDFKYAVTIQKSYTDWEYWIERANWFFYRELYRNWHPVFTNSYEVYWERNDMQDENTISDTYDVVVEPLEGASVKLVLQTDKSVNGIADIYIDYSVEKDRESKLIQLQFRRELMVSDPQNSMSANFLREEGAEYIPMPIKYGYGELILQACPQGGALLDLKEVRCDNIYRTGNCQLSSLTDENWTAGYSNTANILLFEYDEELLADLQQSQNILCNGNSFLIENIDYDSLWIRVSVGSDASICKYPNYIQLE